MVEYGSVITKSFLGTVHTIVFVASILSKSYLMHLLTKSSGQLFLYKKRLNLSIYDEIW